VGRKKKHEEEENNERWLVSYADFITLLFAFFTTLYAISTVDAQKMGKMVYSMQQSFDATVFEGGSKSLSLSQGSGGEGSSSSNKLISNIKIPDEIKIKEAILSKSATAGKTISSKKDLYRLKRSIDTLLGSEALKGSVRTRIDPRGLVISLGEGGFFDSGSEIIKPDGRILLDTIATSLVSLGNLIRIEGHTDSDPISNSKFSSNWELSGRRASEIVRYLIEKFGFNPQLLSTGGYAEFKPMSSNDTEEGKARNRRVDIVILNPQTAQEEPEG
jgi:chemotaxis protein MotB